MTELTDTERETLTRLFGWVPEPEPLELLLDEVAAILTARLARVEALADDKYHPWDTVTVREIRAALAAPTPDEVQP